MLTALGIPRGFFIPYRYVRGVLNAVPPYPEVAALCAASPWREFLVEIASHRAAFATFGASADEPSLDRGLLSTLDGMAAYTAVRRFKPRRILEVGSGDSTYFLARAARDNGLGEITCIDPAPRREIEGLGVHLERRCLCADDAVLADELQAGDILFIDSSHILLPGTDVDILFNRFFPRLKPGVIVHVHDIFLPDGYPAGWNIWNYSEQAALIAWLVARRFEILWPAQFAFTRHGQEVQQSVGGLASLDAGGGSMWLRCL
jgi:predicted O-methyltransferase YrrM